MFVLFLYPSIFLYINTHTCTQPDKYVILSFISSFSLISIHFWVLVVVCNVFRWDNGIYKIPMCRLWLWHGTYSMRRMLHIQKAQIHINTMNSYTQTMYIHIFVLLSLLKKNLKTIKELKKRLLGAHSENKSFCINYLKAC